MLKISKGVEKFWKKVRTDQILVFAGIFAGLFLIYTSSVNTYIGTPVTDYELRFTQGLVGFSFIFTALVLFVHRKTNF